MTTSSTGLQLVDCRLVSFLWLRSINLLISIEGLNQVPNQSHIDRHRIHSQIVRSVVVRGLEDCIDVGQDQGAAFNPLLMNISPTLEILV
jgi:hypothetical protein